MNPRSKKFEYIYVTPKSARGLPATNRKTGTNNAYVRVTCNFNGQDYRTKVAKKSAQPEWDEKFRFFSPPIDGHLVVTVMNKDKWPKHDRVLGEAKIAVADLKLGRETELNLNLDAPRKSQKESKDEMRAAPKIRLVVLLEDTRIPKKVKDRKSHDIDAADGADAVDAISAVEAPEVPDPAEQAPGTAEDFSKNYSLGELIGKGGFSKVMMGTHIASGIKVAVKVIDKTGTPEDEVEVMHREIDIMRKLSHPHIIQLIDHFEDSNTIWLVLELVPGGELFDAIIERGHYGEAEAGSIVKQLINAVDYMHENGIAHRDLKPENILCCGAKKEIIKVADFGLSKDFGTSRLQTSLGTPGYVAPEVLMGGPYDKAVDMWSIGVITYVLLCGFTPFWAEDQRELFQLILAARYSFPAPEWTNVSDSAKDFIRKLLVVQSEKRMTARQALEHPWLANAVAVTAPVPPLDVFSRFAKKEPAKKDTRKKEDAKDAKNAKKEDAKDAKNAKKEEEPQRVSKDTKSHSRASKQSVLPANATLEQRLTQLEARFEAEIAQLKREVTRLKNENTELKTQVKSLCEAVEM